MKVVKNQKNQNAETISLDRSELAANQERAYQFAEKMLEKGTDLLKIEARSRLAANGLCFTKIYHALAR